MPAEPPVFRLHEGQLPLLISMPHDGTAIPARLRDEFRDSARGGTDTDWHIATLYEFAAALGASLLVPGYSRYVVDLNRPADGSALYPGRVETGLCPLVTFAGEPLYRPGREPDADELARRRNDYWQPYHTALRDELARLRAAHPQVLLWEAHSIEARCRCCSRVGYPTSTLAPRMARVVRRCRAAGTSGLSSQAIRLQLGGRWSFQGGLHHVTTGARYVASMPCNSRWPSSPIWTSRRFATTRVVPGVCGDYWNANYKLRSRH